MQKLVSLSKRRGFVFQSSEIYGGINACWDYGPLGVELKHNIKSAWWNAMTRRPDIDGIDAAILMHPQVWKSSGHVDGFTDPLVDCKKCKARFRTDNEIYSKEKKCPSCGSTDLSEPRNFNLMFKTFMGPLEDAASVVYLRPETAQGIYVNYQNVQVTARRKIPFGIAQIGKAFRNEITPGNFIFRTREFEQMEMQYFVKPGTDEKWMSDWKERRMQWYLDHGFKKQNLQYHQHGEGELAHYAKAAFDIQYKFPFGWQELEGIHNRTDFDLGRHQQASKKNLEYFEEATKEKFIPYIIETSAGCDRSLLACMCDAYAEEVTQDEETKKEEVRVIMRFHPKLAPVKVAFLPLSKKEELSKPTQKLQEEFVEDMVTQYDESSSIGKRYRRQDEIGTPLCVTMDFESLNDKKVTVRHRDSMKQDRVDMSQLKEYIQKKLKNFNSEAGV
ncbi:MAG: glycine--tRNA ligase [Oligoflexia bacterium]|nr:glycine--tRNA ligase [Oligoflexia bacterium]